MGSPSLLPRPWTEEMSPSVFAWRVPGLKCGTPGSLFRERAEYSMRSRGIIWAVEFCPLLCPLPRQLLREQQVLLGTQKGHSPCGKELLIMLPRVGARLLFAVVLRPRKY